MIALTVYPRVSVMHTRQQAAGRLTGHHVWIYREKELMFQGAAFALKGAQSSGPQRASEVARKLSPGKPAAGSGKTLWIVVGLLAVVVIGLVAVVLTLILRRT